MFAIEKNIIDPLNVSLNALIIVEIFLFSMIKMIIPYSRR